LNGVLESKELSLRDLRKTAIREFSIDTSGKVLEELLEKYFNQKT